MNSRTRPLGTALAMVSMIGMLAPTNLVWASAKGRKNTAIGLGAVAAQQLLTGKTTNGLVLGAGAAYAYKQYKDAQRDENRKRRADTYRSNTYSSTNRSNSRYGGSSVAGRSRTTTPSRLVFTGRVTDETQFQNRKITVVSNGVERRLTVPESSPVMQGGAKASVHDLRKGDMVRVSAVRTGPSEWKALRVDVTSSVGVNRDTTYSDRGASYDDRYNRPATATKNYNGVGIVRSVDEDTRSIDVEVGGNIRTIFATDATFNGFRSVGELQRGDRVRVRGDLDGRDVFATEVSLLD